MIDERFFIHEIDCNVCKDGDRVASSRGEGRGGTVED